MNRSSLCSISLFFIALIVLTEEGDERALEAGEGGVAREEELELDPEEGED
jgi:hypothetical protein